MMSEPRRIPRLRPETVVPGERSVLDPRRVIRAYELAVVIPPLVALALVPIRDGHASAAATVMVVPVVLVSLLGSATASVVAACTASLAYGVLLTEPYGRFSIDDPADVVETLVLLAVGIGVGITSSRLSRARARADTRGRELDHVIAYVRSATGATSTDVLVTEAQDRIGDLLHLERCEWSGIPLLHQRPVLLPSGSVMGYQSALNDDRAQLPDQIDLPAEAHDRTLGHFILEPRGGTTTSIEERKAAAAIATLLAEALSRTTDA